MAGPAGRLFWKLLLALWISTLVSIAVTAAYFQWRGFAPPKPDGLMTIGPLPVVPLVSGGIAILITSTALAWYLSRPLNHLRWALHRVAEGRFETRVQPRMAGRRDEIADLALDFDRMAAQLQQLTDSRRVLLHDISHELRSPLTRLQAAIGLLRQDPAQTATMLERIQLESERLDALIEELLTLHRLEAGAVGTRERVDLIELLQAIAEDAEFEARASSRAVKIDAPGSFVAEVNGELLYRAFENVIRNALKYTPPDTVVEIRARTLDKGSRLQVVVQDQGPGVPAAMLQAIFEPFTRVEGSESVRGVGLGLAIAQRAVAAHGGSITASQGRTGGLVVEIDLPAVPSIS